MSITHDESIAGRIGPHAWSIDGQDCSADDIRAALHGWQARHSKIHGRSVALCDVTRTEAVLAACALDGFAALVYLVPEDLKPELVHRHCTELGISAFVGHLPGPGKPAAAPPDLIADSAPCKQGNASRQPLVNTAWVFATSGTTREPRLIRHTRAGLTQRLRLSADQSQRRWGLVYSPKRFAGFQVLLQACLSGSSLIVVDRDLAISKQVERLVAGRCDSLSATPTQWRQMLIAGLANAPIIQATLGGEIANQATLSAIRRAFPDARVTHIYASTEAGVGFAVKDGRAGFPEELVQSNPNLQVREGRLFLRANDEVSGITEAVAGADGWVDSGDAVKLVDGRYHFLGRASGVINVGGLKVFPEHVEQTILQVDGVQLARVYAISSSIVGQLVAADVEPESSPDGVAARVRQHCMESLERHMVPAKIRVVDAIEKNETGKIVRRV